jgi:hypothetical protein
MTVFLFFPKYFYLFNLGLFFNERSGHCLSLVLYWGVTGAGTYSSIGLFLLRHTHTHTHIVQPSQLLLPSLGTHDHIFVRPTLLRALTLSLLFEEGRDSTTMGHSPSTAERLTAKLLLDLASTVVLCSEC